ncbi:unnamed protein product [Cuscuta europaea]|uniref:Transmembrane protein n=1 Tax=Cuscuta europaea TaxID=41803 RepID=A0A9P0ZHT8_CUSEU|nr:unnamed protein product [Cuscuta europaea]
MVVGVIRVGGQQCKFFEWVEEDRCRTCQENLDLVLQKVGRLEEHVRMKEMELEGEMKSCVRGIGVLKVQNMELQLKMAKNDNLTFKWKLLCVSLICFIFFAIRRF